MRRLTERIARATRRLTFDQAGQLAQLAARTGLVWAARAKLALMLGIGRRTVDRVLADLDGRAFIVVAVRGCGGGSVLIPAWKDGADRAATIAGVLRRAGVPDLAPPPTCSAVWSSAPPASSSLPPDCPPKPCACSSLPSLKYATLGRQNLNHKLLSLSLLLHLW